MVPPVTQAFPHSKYPLSLDTSVAQASPTLNISYLWSHLSLKLRLHSKYPLSLVTPVAQAFPHSKYLLSLVTPIAQASLSL
jgi:hypothetical protein